MNFESRYGGRPADKIDQIENRTGEQAHRQTDQEKDCGQSLNWWSGTESEKIRLQSDGLLKIHPWNMGNCFYLDDEQVAYMDGLEDHIQRTGRMILLQIERVIT